MAGKKSTATVTKQEEIAMTPCTKYAGGIHIGKDRAIRATLNGVESIYCTNCGEIMKPSLVAAGHQIQEI